MNQYYPFSVLPLPFGYVDLMPRCDADTLYYHHRVFYEGEVAGLNALAVKHRLTHLSLTDLIALDLNLPSVAERRVKSKAGSVFNHHLYFDGMTDQAGLPPSSSLTTRLISLYGSMQRFERLMTEAAESLIGSGWVFLCSSGGGNVHIVLTENSDAVNLRTDYPILTLDMWEHAYIPIYHFDIPQYVSSWFSLINWGKAERRYLEAQRYFAGGQ